jgi:hypothetical protein
MDENQPIPRSSVVAAQLAQALEKRGQDYAIGGAVALAYWAEPRGTMDVDLTLFLSPDQPSECVRLLQEIGCEVPATEAISLLQEHGFCRATYDSMRVDVFVPTIPFYAAAKVRRRRVPLRAGHAMIWDPETLSVFKMMFFRRKDIADLEQIMRSQSSSLDRNWIREQLVEMYGARDARIAQWDELDREVTQ